MTKRKDGEIVDLAFYQFLNLFYEQNKKKIRSTYQKLTQKFLGYNDPGDDSYQKTAFLRKPQYDALEMYMFLKEYLDNAHLETIFDEWYHRRDRFENRSELGIDGDQITMFEDVDVQTFKAVFKKMHQFRQVYPNYIFALTMGLGKTVLMATCIFYEFLLANKFPHDPRYCHNALVFAPDKTVLQSLKEIQTFDKSKVVPPEYVNWLETHLQFHFLDDSGISLNVIDQSKFNIIISNTQKIILKKQQKEKSSTDRLFADSETGKSTRSIINGYEDLYDFENEIELLENQRFLKLTRLKQLGIYVDEAHHAFGNQLARDFGLKSSQTSLRITINQLAEDLEKAGTKVVACYNYTGTPYVKNTLLPEVVYAYGLKEAIDSQYLKKVNVNGFSNTKSKEFVRIAVREFWQMQANRRYENMLPKIAFFAATIDELNQELRPAVEEVLSELNIPASKVLVNVGDPKLTSNDDLREFINLDTSQSEKQFILLVNKGKEGWNCRSLFAVGLHRKPKSKIFVLQATMRCLRSIGDVQEQAQVYLSEENMTILEDELKDNYRMSVNQMNDAGDKREKVEVRVVLPAVKIRLRQIRKLHQLVEKQPGAGIDFELEKAPTEQYDLIRTQKDIRLLDQKGRRKQVLTREKERRKFSELTLVAEIARYLNRSCLELEDILIESKEGMEQILARVNEYNELLYDWIIPRMFNELYDLIEFEAKEEQEIELVKSPRDGKDCYEVMANTDLLVNMSDPEAEEWLDKSFHLDNYCFDSQPEKALFWTLLRDRRIGKVYFTGMFTHGQTDFVIHYVDPDSNSLRSYYPDFLVRKEDGSYLIVEVKGDNKVEDRVVQAKAWYARQMAAASGMGYEIVKGSEAVMGRGVL